MEDFSANTVRNGSIEPIKNGSYWSIGSPDQSPTFEPVWHAYEIDNQSPPYFIGNIVLEISDKTSMDDEKAWYTLRNGKESFRKYYAKLEGSDVQSF